MNWKIDYEDKSNYEYVGNTTGVSETNGVHKGKTTARFSPYDEATIETIK